MKVMPARVQIIIFSVLRFFLLLLGIVTLISWLVPYITSVGNHWYLDYIVENEVYINQFIKQYIPTTVIGFDLSRPLLILLSFVFADVAKSQIENVKFDIQKDILLQEFKQLKTSASNYQTDQIAMLDLKLEEVELSSGKNRKDLLKDFARIKKELEKIGRDLAFLAIDVVGSTDMKIGEDPVVVESDFLEYHNFVEAKFKEHGLIKAAWTPDGVMACFNTVEDAVKSAQGILKGLVFFNTHVKSIKKDFQIRCGINAGHVFYEDSIPLEQFSDRTIDIAGHMQKHAPPNTILIAKHIVDPVRSRDSFLNTERVVDGLEASMWQLDENDIDEPAEKNNDTHDNKVKMIVNNPNK